VKVPQTDTGLAYGAPLDFLVGGQGGGLADRRPKEPHSRFGPSGLELRPLSASSLLTTFAAPDPWPQVTCIENLVKFERVVIEINRQTDKDTVARITTLRVPAGNEVTMNKTSVGIVCAAPISLFLLTHCFPRIGAYIAHTLPMLIECIVCVLSSDTAQIQPATGIFSEMLFIGAVCGMNNDVVLLVFISLHVQWEFHG